MASRMLDVSQLLVRNAKRYAVVAFVCLLLPAAYYGYLTLVIAALMVPGMALSVGIVALIPRGWPDLLSRLVIVATSTIVSYAAIALAESALGFGSEPDSLDPWSPIYAVTFVGLLSGFIFGWIAVLPARRDIERPMSEESSRG
jgi:hypothetical protein